mmetsp:Transcript_48053/g.159275  ORF Transcript_48053/g.159275 Transcript_48053/m.159275 type:complete len:329 (-) Transcript_48053:136-1122(-)
MDLPRRRRKLGGEARRGAALRAGARGSAGAALRPPREGEAAGGGGRVGGALSAAGRRQSRAVDAQDSRRSAQRVARLLERRGCSAAGERRLRDPAKLPRLDRVRRRLLRRAAGPRRGDGRGRLRGPHSREPRTAGREPRPGPRRCVRRVARRLPDRVAARLRGEGPLLVRRALEPGCRLARHARDDRHPRVGERRGAAGRRGGRRRDVASRRGGSARAAQAVAAERDRQGGGAGPHAARRSRPARAAQAGPQLGERSPAGPSAQRGAGGRDGARVPRRGPRHRFAGGECTRAAVCGRLAGRAAPRREQRELRERALGWGLPELPQHPS